MIWQDYAITPPWQWCSAFWELLIYFLLRQNKCHRSVTRQMPREKVRDGLRTTGRGLHSHCTYHEPVQTAALSSANNPEHTKSVRVSRCTHACRQTCRRHKGTRSMKKCRWLLVLQCSSASFLFPLCFWALRYFLVPQFYELLCCSHRLRRQRPRDELETCATLESNLIKTTDVIRTEDWGRHKRSGINQISCLRSLAGPFRLFWTHRSPLPADPDISTHKHLHFSPHAYNKCMYTKQVHKRKRNNTLFRCHIDLFSLLRGEKGSD